MCSLSTFELNTELPLGALCCLRVFSSCHPSVLRGYFTQCGHWGDLEKGMWTRARIGVYFLLQATFLFLFFPPGWHTSPSVLNNGDNYTFKGSHSKPPERLRNPSGGNHEKMEGRITQRDRTQTAFHALLSAKA